MIKVRLCLIPQGHKNSKIMSGRKRKMRGAHRRRKEGRQEERKGQDMEEDMR